MMTTVKRKQTMIFLTTNKNDIESKQVGRHFPMVTIIEITDPNLVNLISGNETLYLDWRLKTNRSILLMLEVVRGNIGYKILENQGNKYIKY